jgi:hypothetical protein
MASQEKALGQGICDALTSELLERTKELGKSAVIECDPEQDITKKIAIRAGLDFKGIEDGLCLFAKTFNSSL